MLIIYFGPLLPIETRLLLCVAAILTTIALNYIGFLDIFSKQEDITYEGVRYWRILWKEQISLLPQWKATPAWLVRIKTTSIHAVIVWVIPFCLLSFMGYNLLLIFDSWYYENAGMLSETLRDLSDSAVDRIQAGTWDGRTRVRFISLYILGNYIGPNRLPPSTFLCFLFSFAALLPVTVITGISVLCGETKRKRFIRWFHLLLALSKTLKCSLINPQKKAYYLKRIIPNTNKQHWISGVAKFPLMSVTCDAISFLYNNNENSEIQKQMLSWINKCSSPQGGFGAKPGMTADILHTNTALRIRHTLGQLSPSDEILNKKWLFQELDVRLTNSDNTISAKDWLISIDYILEGISYTTLENVFPKYKADNIIHMAYTKWKDSNQTIISTSHYLSILGYFANHDFDEITDEIKNSRLPPWERQLSSLSPIAKLDEIYYIVNIIRSLYPDSYQTRDSIRQVIDNMNKAYCQ